MGGTQSVDKAQKQIGELHSNIDLLVEYIQKNGNDVVNYITSMDYTKQDELCKKLEYQYVDILKKNFPIRELKGIAIAQESGIRRIQLAMLVPQQAKTNRPDLETEKSKICQQIVNLFKRKVEIIQKLQKAVPDCRDRERETYNNLSSRMKSQSNINTEEWEKIYKIMTDFNKDIRTRYTKMNSMIRSVLNAGTEKELDSLQKESVELINDTNAVCDLAIDRELREFRTAEIAARDNSPKVELYQAPIKYTMVKVIQQHIAGATNELTINPGDILTLVNLEDDRGWYTAKDATGKEGLIPANYVEIIR